jgi:hypothetical protein
MGTADGLCPIRELSLRLLRHCHASGRINADGLIGGDYGGHGQKSLQRHTAGVVSKGLDKGGSPPPLFLCLL